MDKLKTDYKNDVYLGNRKYTMVTNDDGTISLVDVTTYTEEGDDFGADDINTTNKAINGILNMFNNNKFEANLICEDGVGLIDDDGNQLIADWKLKEL